MRSPQEPGKSIIKKKEYQVARPQNAHIAVFTWQEQFLHASIFSSKASVKKSNIQEQVLTIEKQEK
jgi:hypothetical protein